MASTYGVTGGTAAPGTSPAHGNGPSYIESIRKAAAGKQGGKPFKPRAPQRTKRAPDSNMPNKHSIELPSPASKAEAEQYR